MSLAVILVDDFDGYIETYAWVEVIEGETDTQEKALACLEAEYPIAEWRPGTATYKVTGCVFQRLSGYAVPGDDDVRSERPLADYSDPCRDCEGRGHQADDDRCEGCRGTGLEIDWLDWLYQDEFQPWETCAADDPEGRPFWKVEVVER